MAEGRWDWLYRLARNKMLLLMLGGAVGTYARYLLGRWVGQHPWAAAFPPLGTLVINVSGSFILGAAAAVILERLPPQRQDWFLLIGTGFCGGYTTFSTFSLETFELAIERKEPWLALAYAVGSVVAGFIGAALGWWMAEAVWPRAAN